MFSLRVFFYEHSFNSSLPLPESSPLHLAGLELGIFVFKKVVLFSKMYRHNDGMKRI